MNNLPNPQINQNQKGKNNNLPTDQTTNILLNQKNVELNNIFKPQSILDTQLQPIPQNLDLLNFGSIIGNIPSQTIKNVDKTPISIPNSLMSSIPTGIIPFNSNPPINTNSMLSLTKKGRNGRNNLNSKFKNNNKSKKNNMNILNTFLN